MVNQIKKALREYSNKDRAEFLSRYFKTGTGEYAENDKFIGVSVPNQSKDSKTIFSENFFRGVGEAFFF